MRLCIAVVFIYNLLGIRSDFAYFHTCLIRHFIFPSPQTSPVKQDVAAVRAHADAERHAKSEKRKAQEEENSAKRVMAARSLVLPHFPDEPLDAANPPPSSPPNSPPAAEALAIGRLKLFDELAGDMDSLEAKMAVVFARVEEESPQHDESDRDEDEPGEQEPPQDLLADYREMIERAHRANPVFGNLWTLVSDYLNVKLTFNIIILCF